MMERLTLEDFLSAYYAYGLLEVRSVSDGKLLFTSRKGRNFESCRRCRVYNIDPQIRLHQYKTSAYTVLVVYINPAEVSE